MASIEHFVPLVRKVIHQTQERVFGGDTRVEGKIISIFEPHRAMPPIAARFYLRWNTISRFLGR